MSPEDNKPDQPTNTPEPMGDMPEDALSRTPEELGQETVEPTNTPDKEAGKKSKVKKPSKLKTTLKRLNLYFLLFLLLVVIAGAVTVVYYLNSKKQPVVPGIADQPLTQKALKELANKNASIGDASQTITIKGSAVINGQTLMRGNLNVAGNLQAGGSIQGSSLTISGKSNLSDTQISSLQVAQNIAIQGTTTTKDLNVAGASTFSGALTASQISTSKLIISGDGGLQITNHLTFTGPSPSRSINGAALGSGGSASVSGSDTSGSVNINTGNNPAAGCFITLNFNKTFAKQPRVIISPIGQAAGRIDYYATRTTSNFSICTSTPSPAHQNFAFDYFIAG